MGGTLATRAGQGRGGGVPGGGGHGGGGQECGTLCHPEGAPCPPPPMLRSVPRNRAEAAPGGGDDSAAGLPLLPQTGASERTSHVLIHLFSICLRILAKKTRFKNMSLR